MAAHSIFSNGGQLGSLCISGARDEHRQHLTEERHGFAGPRVTERNEHFPAIPAERPKQPDYATLNARLTSYNGWDSPTVHPNELADAGFYYTSIKDYVRCFFCGGGIKDWETGDYPWIEHARWFPNCAFLKQSKGDEFIRLCQSSNISDRQQCENMLSPDIPQQTPVIEDQLIEDMQTTASSLVLDMGYSQANVIQAIRYVRQTYGSADLRLQRLLEYLLDNFTPNPTRNATTASQSRSAQTSNSTNCEVQAKAKQSQPKALDLESFAGKESELHENIETTSGLLEENRLLKEEKLCKICLDKEACIVFIPCGHLVTCLQCSQTLRKCAICRANIKDKIRAYPS